MGLKNCKKLYAHYVEQGKSAKTEFSRILARGYADDLRANTLKYRGVDLGKKAKAEVPEEPEEKALSDMTNAELKEICDEKEIEYGANDTKAQLIEAIDGNE